MEKLHSKYVFAYEDKAAKKSSLSEKDILRGCFEGGIEFISIVLSIHVCTRSADERETSFASSFDVT